MLALRRECFVRDIQSYIEDIIIKAPLAPEQAKAIETKINYYFTVAKQQAYLEISKQLERNIKSLLPSNDH